MTPLLSVSEPRRSATAALGGSGSGVVRGAATSAPSAAPSGGGSCVIIKSCSQMELKS
jgi:hypothetical protein